MSVTSHLAGSHRYLQYKILVKLQSQTLLRQTKVELEKTMKPEAATLVGIHCETVSTHMIRHSFLRVWYVVFCLFAWFCLYLCLFVCFSSGLCLFSCVVEDNLSAN